MKLNLSIDTLTKIQWWVDTSYGMHSDSKGNIGTMMTLGKGAAMSLSKRQKLNNRSLNEAELMCTNDTIPQRMWGKYFIGAKYIQ